MTHVVCIIFLMDKVGLNNNRGSSGPPRASSEYFPGFVHAAPTLHFILKYYPCLLIPVPAPLFNTMPVSCSHYSLCLGHIFWHFHLASSSCLSRSRSVVTIPGITPGASPLLLQLAYQWSYYIVISYLCGYVPLQIPTTPNHFGLYFHLKPRVGNLLIFVPRS